MSPEERLEQKRAELAKADPLYGRYREAMVAIEKGRAPVVAAESASIDDEEEPADVPVTQSMADFVRAERAARLPSIQRRHQLIDRERVSLGGKPMYRD